MTIKIKLLVVYFVFFLISCANGIEETSKSPPKEPGTSGEAATLSINDITITELDTESATASFTVTSSVVSINNITVDYYTSGGSATAGSDYISIPTTTLSIPAGTLYSTFTITHLGDLITEGNETIIISLSNAVNATIDDNTAVATIIDNDKTNNLPIFSQTPPNVGMQEDGTFPVLSMSASDADYDTLTWSIVAPTASKGTAKVVMPASGNTVEISYIPLLNKNGMDSFGVQVDDGVGGITEQIVNVTIFSVNDAPIADAGFDQVVTYSRGQITKVVLDATASNDPDGDKLTYLWTYSGCTGMNCNSLTSGEPISVSIINSTSTTPSFELPQDPYASTLQFTVKVIDTSKTFSQSVVSVYVKSRIPVANPGLDQIGVSLGDTVTLDGTASSDFDGPSPLTYQWAQLYGTPVSLSDATSITPTFVFPLSILDRTVEFQLVVNDGESDSIPGKVIVSAKEYDGNNINYTANPFPNTATLPAPVVGTYVTLVIPQSLDVVGTTVYIADREGLKIIDVSNLLSPIQTGNFNTMGFGVDVQTAAGNAYIFSESTQTISNLSLEIVNVSNPTAPIIAGSVTLNPPGTLSNFFPSSMSMTLKNNLTYLLDTKSNLTIVDSTSISAPTPYATNSIGLGDRQILSSALKANNLYVGHQNGIKVINVSNSNVVPVSLDTNIIGSIEDIKFDNGLMYTAYSRGRRYDGGLEIYQSIDNTTFRKTSSFDTNGNANDLVIQGNTLFMIDSKPSFRGHVSGLRIVDITDKSAPALSGSYDRSTIFDNPMKVKVINNTAYIVDSTNGLIIIDEVLPTLTKNFPPTAIVAGSTLNYTFGWADKKTAVTHECLVSAGTCTVSNINFTTNTADVVWVVPPTGGTKLKLSVAVGNYHYFVSAADIIVVP